METKPQEQVKQNVLKDKRFWIKVGTYVIAISVGFGMGQNSATEEFDGVKVRYNSVASIIDEKEASLKELETKIKETEEELEKINSEYDSKKSEFDKAMEIIENKDAVLSQLEEKTAELDDLNALIEEKEKELASLEGKIRETGEKPIELPSGTFIVGQDLPAKRYKAVPVNNNGNFVVRSESGRLKVNQILGFSFGEREHIFYANDGDIVETNMRTKLIPVE